MPASLISSTVFAALFSTTIVALPLINPQHTAIKHDWRIVARNPPNNELWSNAVEGRNNVPIYVLPINEEQVRPIQSNNSTFFVFMEDKTKESGFEKDGEKLLLGCQHANIQNNVTGISCELEGIAYQKNLKYVIYKGKAGHTVFVEIRSQAPTDAVIQITIGRAHHQAPKEKQDLLILNVNVPRSTNVPPTAVDRNLIVKQMTETSELGNLLQNPKIGKVVDVGGIPTVLALGSEPIIVWRNYVQRLAILFQDQPTRWVSIQVSSTTPDNTERRYGWQHQLPRSIGKLPTGTFKNENVSILYVDFINNSGKHQDVQFDVRDEGGNNEFVRHTFWVSGQIQQQPEFRSFVPQVQVQQIQVSEEITRLVNSEKASRMLEKDRNHFLEVFKLNGAVVGLARFISSKKRSLNFFSEPIERLAIILEDNIDENIDITARATDADGRNLINDSVITSNVQELQQFNTKTQHPILYLLFTNPSEQEQTIVINLSGKGPDTEPFDIEITCPVAGKLR